LLLVISLFGCSNKENQGQKNGKNEDVLDKGTIVGFALKLYDTPMDAPDEVDFSTADLHYFYIKNENNCIYNEVSGNLEVSNINVSNKISVEANYYVPKSSTFYLAIYDIIKKEESYELLHKSMYSSSFSILELSSQNNDLDSLSYNLKVYAIDGVNVAVLKEFNENDECINKTTINYQTSDYEFILSEETSYYVIEESTISTRNLHIFNKEEKEINYTIMFIIDDRITPMNLKIK